MMTSFASRVILAAGLAVAAGQSVPCPNPQGLDGELGGLILKPGCYVSNGGVAFGLTGVLTLDGPGDYSFSTLTALTTAAASAVQLQNGASCGSVSWSVGAAATLGASSTFSGSIVSGAAITLGANVAVRGSLSAGADLVFGSNSTAAPCNSDPNTGGNDVGPVTDNCSIYTPIPATLGGQVVGPGCYVSADNAAFDLTGTLILSGPGAYTFSTNGAFTSAANSAVSLVAGADCASVLWLFGGAATTGATSSFSGSIEAGGAITLGAITALHGSVLSLAGVVNYGDGAVVVPCL
jgi:hypothetical protein